jgi:hypothetical protein
MQVRAGCRAAPELCRENSTSQTHMHDRQEGLSPDTALATGWHGTSWSKGPWDRQRAEDSEQPALSTQGPSPPPYPACVGEGRASRVQPLGLFCLSSHATWTLCTCSETLRTVQAPENAGPKENTTPFFVSSYCLTRPDSNVLLSPSHTEHFPLALVRQHSSNLGGR